MRVLFKQAVHLCGRDYALGSHDVSDAVMKSPFFQRLVNAGMVLDAEEAKVISSVPLQDRQKELSEKLASLKAESVPTVSESPVVPVESSPAPAGENESSPEVLESSPVVSESPPIEDAVGVDEAMADAIADVMEEPVASEPVVQEQSSKKQKKHKR